LFSLKEYRVQNDRLIDLLPWAALVAPSVILNKDGSFQQTLRFRGPDLQSSSEQQLVAAMARLNNVLKRLGSSWALFVEARRDHSLDYTDESELHFPDVASHLLDLERRQSFEGEGEHYESHYYITFQCLAPTAAEGKAASIFVKSSKKNITEDEIVYKKSLQDFIGQVLRFYDILRDFMYTVEILNDSQTLTYLHSCISNRAHQVAVPDQPMYLDAYIADTDFYGGIAPKLGDKYLKTITVLSFPGASMPAMLDQLNHLPISYRWVTRFLPIDKLEAEGLIKKYRKQWFAKRKGLLTLLSETLSKSESAMSDTAAVQKSADADQAYQILSDDQVSYGYYTATITVSDEDPKKAEGKIREVMRVINGMGFTCVEEKLNAVDAWVSSLPGQAYANVRMPLLHTLNLSHMLPFSSPWAGPEINSHFKAPVLFHAKTLGNTPFRFSNHIGDVGHQLVIGPTGAGKSVLLNFMACQFLKYKDAYVVIFDQGGSFLASTRCVNGEYYEIGDPDELIFQPLRNIDQKEELIWAMDWILGLLIGQNIDINPERKGLLWDALNNLKDVPVEQRTLSGLQAFVQDEDVREALNIYVIGGAYGELLDAVTKDISYHNWQCFEMTRLLATPEVIPPVLDYIFHNLEKKFDGRPVLLVLDEGWAFLDHPLFLNKIKEWMKTLRKKNVSVIFATQSIDDLLNSNISTVMLESCLSRVFLPNDRALEPKSKASYESLGLNDQQIHIIAHSQPKAQYYFESQKGNSLFELGLGDLALSICGTSRPQEQKKVKSLFKKHKKSNIDFLKAFFQEKGLLSWVDLINSMENIDINKPGRLDKGAGDRDIGEDD
jgi:type IV secretion system protein TrbE